MSANKQVAQREAQAVQGKGEEPALVPAVDIYEDEHGITVQADMPGVAKERLNIQADRNSLLIEGEAAIDTRLAPKRSMSTCRLPGFGAASFSARSWNPIESRPI